MPEEYKKHSIPYRILDKLNDLRKGIMDIHCPQMNQLHQYKQGDWTIQA